MLLQLLPDVVLSRLNRLSLEDIDCHCVYAINNDPYEPPHRVPGLRNILIVIQECEGELNSDCEYFYEEEAVEEVRLLLLLAQY